MIGVEVSWREDHRYPTAVVSGHVGRIWRRALRAQIVLKLSGRVGRINVQYASTRAAFRTLMTSTGQSVLPP